MLIDLKGYNAFYALGGNTFTLRTAMKLSGFDDYLKELAKQSNYLYSGFSAGNKLPYKTLKDGDAIISDTCENILLK